MRWIVIAVLLTFAGCQRRPLEQEPPTTARIRVSIDWSDSNIPVTRDDPTGGEHVHRTSLRFYPVQGGQVLERYLEGNIFEGTVEVPLGSYNVVAMNESVADTHYWQGAVTFADVDDFERFSASVEAMPPGRVRIHHPFYDAARGEKINVEPLRLASWSIRGLEVTPQMATRAQDGPTIEVKMRRLTYNVAVTAHVRNLVSAQSFHTALRGMADRVTISSGETHNSPSTHVFRLNDRQLDGDGRHGTVSRSLLSMGRLPEHAERGGGGERVERAERVERVEGGEGVYTVSKDIVLRSGRLHTAAGPLSFDVTDQVVGGAGPDIEITIGSELDPIELPWVEGGIWVEPWEDETIDLH